MASFDNWFKELIQIQKDSLVVEVEMAKDAWKEYYEDGYSPAEALSEDASYGE